MAADGSSLSRVAVGKPRVGRRVATAALLGALGMSLLLAVPALRPVVHEIRAMSPVWVTLAVALELASCVSFVVVFRLFFDRVPARDGRSLAWTSQASGALLPGGGVGGLAIGGWLIHLTGAPTSWIVRRSSGLFFLTTAVNSAAVIGSALLLLTGYPGPAGFGRAGLPLLLAGSATLLVAALPRATRRRSRRAAAPLLVGIVAGIRDAQRTAADPSWRLLGAVGYLGFDIAVLWATFSAIGHAPPAPALVLGYTIGYLANTLPIPGGIGVLDAGLTGALLLYGASPTHAAAAVLVYHAIAFWIPALGGVLAYAGLRPRLIDRASADPLETSHTPTSIPTLKGSHDRHCTDDRARQARMGRIPDERPRTRPLSRDRRQVARPALPHRLRSTLTRARSRRRTVTPARSPPSHHIRLDRDVHGTVPPPRRTRFGSAVMLIRLVSSPPSWMKD
jgi:uncharacterized membrane protein YbhN (UPF0104 family)